MEQNNSMDMRSVAQKISDSFVPLVERQLTVQGAQPDAYQRQCMVNAIVVMNDAARDAGLESVAKFSRTEVMEILQQVATLRLNAFSTPRECYFQTRKKKQADGTWGVCVEMGIEGDGNDAILRNFGQGVDVVYPYWAVREDDEFTYPTYNGIDVVPPCWTPCGHGKYARVVYPVRFLDGPVRYFIAERSDVRVNLAAHISNNMMNETFGLAENRYKATVQQKQEIDARKSQLKALMEGKDVDEILEIPELQPYISPAWRDGGRERMILRKMRNNAIKPIPKDFSSAAALSMYRRSVQDGDGDVIDADYRAVPAAQTIQAPETDPDNAIPAASLETEPESVPQAAKAPF